MAISLSQTKRCSRINHKRSGRSTGIGSIDLLLLLFGIFHLGAAQTSKTTIASSVTTLPFNVTLLSICPIVPLQNRITVATAIGGCLGSLGSLLILLVIFSYSKDKLMLRERIVAGLSLANFFYSAICVVPLWYRRPAPDCGYINEVHIIVSLRVAWFASKYVIASYEIFILAASIYLLKANKSTLPKFAERCAHTICWVVGIMIIIPCLLFVNRIATRDKTEYYHAGKYSDGADGGLRAVTHTVIDLNTFVIIVTQVWIGLFLIAVILWFWLRCNVLRNLLKHLQQKQTDTETLVTDSRPGFKNRLKLLHVQRQGYFEVVKPLEPYVIVFLVFLPPIVVLALPFCNDHTDNHQTCQAPCEMVLAFRALGSSLVYFASKQCRQELYDWRGLSRRLFIRLFGRCSGHKSVRFDGCAEYQQGEDHDADDDNGSVTTDPPAFMSRESLNVDDDDIVYDLDDIGQNQEYFLMEQNA